MSNEKVALSYDEIKEILPHRYPILLVDKVLDWSKENLTLTAVKAITGNEPVFQGHFPDEAIFPGIFMIEAAAQASGLLYVLCNDLQSEKNISVYFMSIEKAKFRKPVKPGTLLTIKTECIQQRSSMAKMSSNIFDDEGDLVCEVVASAMISIDGGK